MANGDRKKRQGLLDLDLGFAQQGSSGDYFQSGTPQVNNIAVPRPKPLAPLPQVSPTLPPDSQAANRRLIRQGSAIRASNLSLAHRGSSRGKERVAFGQALMDRGIERRESQLNQSQLNSNAAGMDPFVGAMTSVFTPRGNIPHLAAAYGHKQAADAQIQQGVLGMLERQEKSKADVDKNRTDKVSEYRNNEADRRLRREEIEAENARQQATTDSDAAGRDLRLRLENKVTRANLLKKGEDEVTKRRNDFEKNFSDFEASVPGGTNAKNKGGLRRMREIILGKMASFDVDPDDADDFLDVLNNAEGSIIMTDDPGALDEGDIGVDRKTGRVIEKTEKGVEIIFPPFIN